MKNLLVILSFVLFLNGIAYAQDIDTSLFLKWLDDNCVDLSNNSDSGYDSLVGILSDKTVIGLGECVHGSSTINNLRFDIAKRLIENGGFNTVAFEMSFNTGLRLNRYIQTGRGDIKATLGESHFFLNSREMMEFVKWLRKQNSSGDRQLNLYGFDIQSNIDLVEDLVLYYKGLDSKAETYAELLEAIFTEHEFSSFQNYSSELQDSTLKIIDILTLKHNGNKKRFIQQSGYIEYENTVMRLKILSHYLKQLNSGYAQSIKMRDSCNAEIISWIKDFEGEHSKLILFAHNGHLAGATRFIPRVRTLTTDGFYEDYPRELLTGYYLRKFFKDGYYFIGTQFGNGYFMGFDSQNDFTLSKLKVEPPESGSFNFLLQNSSHKTYFIDFEFSRTTPRQVINYICSLQSFYEIGAAYDFKYSKARIIDYFDAIIYIDEIEESDLFKFKQ